MDAHHPPLRTNAIDMRIADDPSATRSGWAAEGRLPLAVLCIVLVGIDLRPGIASMGPLLPTLRASFDMSNIEASILTALPPLLMGLMALPTPWLAHRLGRNRTIILSLGVLSIATMARALVNTPELLFLATALVGGGIAVAGALIGGFVKENFPDKTTLVMGIYAMSLGLGASISAGLTAPLEVLTQDWRISSGVWALRGLSAIAAWYVLARGEGRKARKATAAPRSRLPIRHGLAWRIALYFGFNNILFFGFLSWLVPIFIERGSDVVQASLILTGFTVAFMVSNPLAGLLGRSGNRRTQIALAATVALAGILGLILWPQGPGYLFVAAIALGVGSSFTLGMTLPLDSAPTRLELNGWNAFVMALGYGMGALGPLAIGISRDLSGGFQLPLWLLAAIALSMLCISPFLQHRSRQ